MGKLADRLSLESADQTVEQLRVLQRQARELGGQITNLAAGYKAIRAAADDEDDLTALDARLAKVVLSLKADMDRLDSTTRTIVDSVIDGVFGARA